MADYNNLSFRIVDVGLDLRDVNDKVKEGQWVRLKNAESTQEALLTTRKGRALLVNTGVAANVHTIKRLDDFALLIGVGTRLFANSTEYVYPTPEFSANPLSIAVMQPESSPNVWGYIADSNVMRKVDSDGHYFKWGITGGMNAVTVTIGGAGGLNSSVPGAVGYDWRVVYTSSLTGARSNPTPIMPAKVTVVNQSANVSVSASLDPQVDGIEVYRRGGVIPNQWRLTTTGPNTTGVIVDSNADADIATALPLSISNDVPFTTVGGDGNAITEVAMPYIAGPFLGKYILACGDPVRPGFLHWTNAGEPDGAASTNNVQVTSPAEPLIGICLFLGTPYVFTRDNLYGIDYGQTGLTFRGRLTSCGRGMAAPWAFAVGPEIYFWSQDGIYATSGDAPANSISEAIRPIFRGEDVGTFKAVDYSAQGSLRLQYAGQLLHVFYKDTSGDNQHLIWDSQYDRWRQVEMNEQVPTSIYDDENQHQVRTYIGTNVGKVLEIGGSDDVGLAIDVNARTGSMDFDAPQTFKELGNIIVDANPQGGTITITPYTEAEEVALTPIMLTGTGRQKWARSLNDTYCHSVAFDFAWSEGATIYQFELLWRMDEEAVRHWEFPETTHGLGGWQHLRDGYITVRSSAPLTLTVTVDGTPYTATFRASTNTGGARRKLYFDMPPTKGKVFRYSIDSEADFRLYGEDCELRLKPWNTALGYQLVSPFRKAVLPGQQ